MKNLHYILIAFLLFGSVSIYAATTPVTVNFNDGGGNPITTGATLKYHDNTGWHTAIDNNDGTFTANIDGTSITYEMSYNYGKQTLTSTTATNPFVFQTASTSLSLKDSDGNPISGGSVKFHNTNWSPSYPSNTVLELLPATYTVKMDYNLASQTKSGQVISGTSDEVLFETVTTTLALEDSDGNPISGGSVKFHNTNWSPSYPSNTVLELLPATYTVMMDYNYASQTKSGQSISGASDEFLFETVTTSLSLKDSDGNPISGGSVQFHNTNWSPFQASNTVLELLPATYTVKMNYNYASNTKSGEVVSGASDEILFSTTTTNVKLVDCDDNPLTGGTFTFHNSAWASSANANVAIELLPATYIFKMNYNHASEQRNGVAISGASQDVTFGTTQINYVYGGTIQFHNTSWGTYTQGMHFLPVNYTFKFDNHTVPNFVVSGCDMNGNLNIFFTKKANGTPLPNITIKRNDYGSHYTTVGTTDANGLLFSLDQPDGSWKYRADKDYSTQFIISGPNNILFKTAKYTAHVKHTDGSPFEGVSTEYNDYGSHWIDLSPQYTDANGNASIELFAGDYNFRAIKNYSKLTKNLELLTPGASGVVNFQTATFKAHVTKANGDDFEGIATEYNDYSSHWIDLSPQYTDATGNAWIELFPGEYKFRATKNYSSQSKMHEILTSGTTENVEFQTSEYVAHVMKHDGSPFEGIATEYNDYSSHWIDLSPQYTDAAGNASIELFPGDHKFRATKNYSHQTENLEILTSGISDVVNFQTALAEGLARDCDLGTGVAGISFEYNDYSSHWIDLSPSVTGVDGLASIELFPGTYNIRAKTIYTYKTETVNLAGPITQTEFNPTRVSLNYSGTVKYNDYSSHWITMNPNTYMFPGTYDFRFYTGSTIDQQMSINVAGCFINEALIFVQLQNSAGGDLAGGDFDYRYGYGSFTNLGVDGTGSGFWAFVNGNPTNTKVKVSYAGASVEKQQNVQVNPVFIFNTVDVTADLKDSQGGPLTADTWEYRYGYGGFSPLTNGGHELLPVNTKVKVGYKGATVEMQQNVGTTPHFDFATKGVTAELKSSNGSGLTADGWKYRYGYGPYSTLNPLGEELLPVNVKVTVDYKGASVETQQNVGTTPHYVFTTSNVTAALESSTNSPLTADGWKYRYGYGPYSTLNPLGEELLPVNVKVTVDYKGASVEKQQHVGSAPAYVFTTESVTAELKSSTGGGLTADGWKYRYGYGPYSVMNNAGEELLPVNVKVKVYYKGACVEKQQNVGSNSDYDFNTVLVTADLKDGSGSSIPADAWDYRYGYGSFSTLNNAGEELLPVNVKVRATYNSTSKEKQQNVSSSPDYFFTWNGSTINKLATNDSDFNANAVNVYPNPSDGQFTIENIKSFNLLSIIDMTGKLVYQINLNEVENMTIDMNNPVSGAYMIKLDGVASSTTTPLIIK